MANRDHREDPPDPGNLSEPLPGFGEKENRRVAESILDGGVFLKDIKPGGTVKIKTKNNLYTLTKQSADEYVISGHPDYCPTPTPVIVGGSTWGGSMIRLRFVGRNTHLELHLQDMVILTSEIEEVWEVLDNAEKS